MAVAAVQLADPALTVLQVASAVGVAEGAVETLHHASEPRNGRVWRRVRLGLGGIEASGDANRRCL
jgi:hypothetical protein